MKINNHVGRTFYVTRLYDFKGDYLSSDDDLDNDGLSSDDIDLDNDDDLDTDLEMRKIISLKN